MENSKYSWTFSKHPPKMQRFSGRLREVAAEGMDRKVVSSNNRSWHIYIWKRIYYMQFLSYDMSSSTMLLNVRFIVWVA